MTEEKKKPSIAIIGGTGEFGSLFAKVFKKEGHSVVITGRNTEKGARVAASLGVNYDKNNTSSAEKADIVIICVPIENTDQVIEEVAPHVKAGGLLMDFTSVKVEPMKRMLEMAGKGVEVVGSHPMFGPRVTSLEGQILILTPKRPGKWLDFLKDFWKDQGLRVFISTPDEHDKIMAIVQGLTHFAYITTASTIRNIDGDVEKSRKYASPVYELMLDFIARIVGQNPHLYSSIQMFNPYVPSVHETFIKEAKNLSMIVKKGDVNGFVKQMVSSAKIFRDVDSSMGKSDKAISAITHELKRLKASIGSEVALTHIYSGKVHIGKVVSITPENVVLEQNEKKTKLKLSNIELMDEEEKKIWKIKNLKGSLRDFSFIFSSKVDETTLKKAVQSSSDNITSCEVIDVFKGDQIPVDHKSITFRIEALDKTSIKSVENFLIGLGGVPR